MPLSPSAQKVQNELVRLGFDLEIKEHTQTTRTSEDAARAVGCGVGQIAKSLIFKTKEGERPVLVIASGSNRVDEKAVGRLIGAKIGRADADFVRRVTGYAIGGIPPIGHVEPPIILIDEDLTTHDEIWAAAGNPRAVFRLSPSQLESMTGGQVAEVKKS